MSEEVLSLAAQLMEAAVSWFLIRALFFCAHDNHLKDSSLF